MKRLLYLLLLIPLNGFSQGLFVQSGGVINLETTNYPGDYFVDPNLGNDDNAGTSYDVPWKTVAKVNGFTFDPMDTICFKKEGEWRERLVVPRDSLIFMSYGTGAKPKILGSNQAITWTTTAYDSIWQSATTLIDPYNLTYGEDSEVMFIEQDDSIKWANYRKDYTENFSNLSQVYDWTWNANVLYVYSGSDPDTRFKSIEAPQRHESISLNGKQFIEINGFELAYAVSGVYDGVYPTEDLSGAIVRNCKVHHLGTRNGGGYGINVCYNNSLIELNEVFEAGRRAICFYNYGEDTLENIVIQNNICYDGYHTVGIDISAGGGTGLYGSFDSIIIRNNLIYEDEYDDIAISRSTSNFFKTEQGGYIHGLYIYNNIIKFTEGAGLQLEGPAGVYIYNNTFYGVNKNSPNNLFFIEIYDGSTGATDYHVKNNIFYDDGVWGVNYSAIIYLAGDVVYTDVESDYNLYYTTDADAYMVLQEDPEVIYHTSNFATMQSVWSWDTNSPTPADPTFTTTINYHLQTGSPAIDNGVAAWFVTDDFDGVARGTPPNIGAMETTEDP